MFARRRPCDASRPAPPTRGAALECGQTQEYGEVTLKNIIMPGTKGFYNVEGRDVMRFGPFEITMLADDP